MPTSVTLPQHFQRIVRSHLPYAEASDLNPTDELVALGLDSMGVIQLLTDLEEGYEVEFPDEVLTQDTFVTVGSLWQTVATVLSPEQRGDE